MNHRLRKDELLRHNQDIERVLFRGKRLQDGAVRVYYRPAVEPGNRRAGVITAGKFPNAVTRNRVRRQLREIFRTNKEQFPLGYDYLLRADKTALTLKYDMLNSMVLGLVGKLAPGTGGS